MERQRTPSGPRTKSTTSLNLTWMMGPPNSPDINSVDYAIWGALQQRVYCLPLTTIQDGGITEASESHRVAKTLTAFH